MKIANSVVLINSAGSLLGRKLAAHFSHQHATLVLVDDNPIELRNTHRSIEDGNATVFSFVLSDYSQSSIDELFSHIEYRLGRGVDILVNNLESTVLPELIGTNSAEEFTRGVKEFSSKLYGFGHASAVQMRKNNTHGVIVNVISNDNLDEESLTDSSMLVNSVTKTWAKQLDQYHIRVGSVVPGANYDPQDSKVVSLTKVCHELIRNTEYVVANDYFSGRVVSS